MQSGPNHPLKLRRANFVACRVGTQKPSFHRNFRQDTRSRVPGMFSRHQTNFQDMKRTSTCKASRSAASVVGGQAVSKPPRAGGRPRTLHGKSEWYLAVVIVFWYQRQVWYHTVCNVSQGHHVQLLNRGGGVGSTSPVTRFLFRPMVDERRMLSVAPTHSKSSRFIMIASIAIPWKAVDSVVSTCRNPANLKGTKPSNSSEWRV